jgi:hypothetical protein
MYVKLIIYAPKKDKDKILQKLFSLGAGHFGNYDSYSFVSEGTTTFRALDSANPANGRKKKIIKVKEVKIETICKENEYQMIIKEIRKIHTYEEPAFCVYKIEDLSL